jgi:hypothetical protein
MTVSYCWVGVKPTSRISPTLLQGVCGDPQVLVETDGFTRNRIFVDRMNGTGVISTETPSVTGSPPLLRATGGLRRARTACTPSTTGCFRRAGRHGGQHGSLPGTYGGDEQSMRIVGAPAICQPALSNSPGDRATPPAAEMRPCQSGNIAAFAGDSADLSNARGSGVPTSLHRYNWRLPPPGGYLRQHRRAHAATSWSCSAMSAHPRRVYFRWKGPTEARVLRGEQTGNPYRVRSVPALYHVGLVKILTGDMIADMIPTFGSVKRSEELDW